MKMKHNQISGYWKVMGSLIYAVLLIGYLFLASYFASELARYNSIHFNITRLILLAVPFSNIIFGCLLGLRYFIGQTRRKGTWSVDLVKLIVLGLPSLFLTFYFFMMIKKPFLPTWLTLQFFDMCAVVFGYVLITSFYKSKILFGDDRHPSAPPLKGSDRMLVKFIMGN
jgi:Na+-driven multidrug efflux pump